MKDNILHLNFHILFGLALKYGWYVDQILIFGPIYLLSPLFHSQAHIVVGEVFILFYYILGRGTMADSMVWMGGIFVEEGWKEGKKQGGLFLEAVRVSFCYVSWGYSAEERESDKGNEIAARGGLWFWEWRLVLFGEGESYGGVWPKRENWESGLSWWVLQKKMIVQWSFFSSQRALRRKWWISWACLWC